MPDLEEHERSYLNRSSDRSVFGGVVVPKSLKSESRSQHCPNMGGKKRRCRREMGVSRVMSYSSWNPSFLSDSFLLKLLKEAKPLEKNEDVLNVGRPALDQSQKSRKPSIPLAQGC